MKPIIGVASLGMPFKRGYSGLLKNRIWQTVLGFHMKLCCSHCKYPLDLMRINSKSGLLSCYQLLVKCYCNKILEAVNCESRRVEAREMAQRLRVLPSLREDLSSVHQHPPGMPHDCLILNARIQYLTPPHTWHPLPPSLSLFLTHHKVNLKTLKKRAWLGL